MVRLLDSVMIPNLGAWPSGALVILGEEIEAQLVAAGKAEPVEGDNPDEPAYRVDPQFGSFEEV